MAAKPCFSDKKAKEVVKKYQEGFSLIEVGKIYKVSGVTILHYLIKMGVKRRPSMFDTNRTHLVDRQLD